MDLRLGLASIEEAVVVTADAPLLEVGRGGAAGYVTEEEMEALPLSGRDFVRFALLQPTVQVDARGSVSLSGQRGVNRLPRSPLDAARGVAVDDDRYAVDECRRYNWGASLGGPIRRDRTHFFLSYDQTAAS